MGRPKSPYSGYERFKARLRGKSGPRLADLGTDWDGADEYLFFLCWKGWDKAQVDAYPLYLRARARAAFEEWNKMLRGE